MKKKASTQGTKTKKKSSDTFKKLTRLLTSSMMAFVTKRCDEFSRMAYPENNEEPKKQEELGDGLEENSKSDHLSDYGGETHLHNKKFML